LCIPIIILTNISVSTQAILIGEGDMWVVRADHTEPWRNLALEELCLEKVGPKEYLLFLWQSSDAIVVGKNQNPWMECCLAEMERGGAKLARRLSGGGAVFHDTGNLNYAFVMPRREYQDQMIFDIVKKALHRFGVQATVMGKSSLAVNGRKVSGNAFCYRRENVLHHGTLLISTDLDKMARYLTPPPCPIRSRAIRSNPAPVANLREIVDSITVPRMAVALTETAAAEWQEPIIWSDDKMFESKVLDPLEKKYASWEWRFGMTPPFELELSRRFNWGESRVKLFVEKAVIRKLDVELPGHDRRIAPLIRQVLTNTPYSETEISDRLRKEVLAFDKNAASEFGRWLVGS
jgi:lipoate---protein ligase